jgi:prepilin-type N-terminal cleavage/methylation domain-containing protein
MKPRLQNGITLIELLIAMSLLGLISLGMLFAMRIGVNSWQHANKRMSADRSVIAASDLITEQLAGARAKVVGWGPLERRAGFLYFEGRAGRMRLLTDYSVAARVRGGMWIAEYWFESNARNECRLMYNERPFRSDDDIASTVNQVVTGPAGYVADYRAPVTSASTRVLYSGIHNCTFEYLVEPFNAPVYWTPNWTSDNRLLPRAVAVRFKGEEADGIAPVAIVATLNAREVWP